MLESIKGTLKSKEISFLENVSFKSLTTIKCGGVAPLVVMPRTVDQFVFTLRALLKTTIPFRVVGNMSNILPPDDEYSGVVIKTTLLYRVAIDENTVTAECGAKISNVLWLAAKKNLGGAEGLFMIPGTLGGMVYGNAGAYGVSMSDFFIRGTFFDPYADRVISLSSAEMKFSYRHSVLSSRELYLLSASLSLQRASFESIRLKIAEFARQRRISQPTTYPSLGSVFRRDGDIIPARIIDELGLKGTVVGGAAVSEKHAGFIINYDNATASDVRELVDKIKKEVADRLSYDLKREIEYL